MNINTSGFGTYSIDTYDGVLTLIRHNPNNMDKIKIGGLSRYQMFLINASYSISNGTLFITGESTELHSLHSGSFGEFDYEGTKEEIDKLKEAVWIGDENITFKVINPWFKPKYVKHYIKNGYYLKRKGISVTYKSSSFKIIE